MIDVFAEAQAAIGHAAWWGKASRTGPEWHPASFHMLDVAAVSQRLLKAVPGVADRLGPLAAWVPLFAALHDIGKFSDCFQRLSPTHHALANPAGSSLPPVSGRLRHTDAGFLLWMKTLASDLGPLGRLGITGRPGWAHIASAVTSHHGTPARDILNDYAVGELFTRAGFGAAMDHVELVVELLAPSASVPSMSPKDLRKQSMLLAGLMVLADWLGSSDEFEFDGAGMTDREYWHQKALPRAALVVAKAGFGMSAVASQVSFAEVFPHLAEQAATPLQTAAAIIPMAKEPSFFVLEDSPGSGKTEAACYLAHRLMSAGAARGVFIGLPTMATANGMFDRMVRSYRALFTPDSTPSLVLAHGRSGHDERFQGTVGGAGGGSFCNPWLAENKKRALLADVGVGTIDQALLGILPSKHQCLRLLGLADKVLLVDEVHACDAYMHRLLQSLVEFQAMAGGSVILLSATMASAQRQSLLSAFARGRGVASPAVQSSAYPLLTGWSETQGVQEVPVAAASERTVTVERLDTDEQALDLLSSVSERNGCGCWVRNTVSDARAAYEMLRARLGPDKVMLLHARFPAGDRQRLEREVTEVFGHPDRAQDMHRRPGMILVATQVVEQSLDIDFDAMVSDLAPVDMLIQRMGRLHRHSRGTRPSPVFHVLGPSSAGDIDEHWFSSRFPSGSFVYGDVGQLWKTMRAVEAAGEIALPGDARTLVETMCDDNVAIPEALVPATKRVREAEAAAAMTARGRCLQPGRGYQHGDMFHDDEIVATRLGERPVQVRLYREEGGRIVPWGLRSFADGDISVSETQIDEAEEDVLGAVRQVLRMPSNADMSFIPVVLSLSDEAITGVARCRGRDVTVRFCPEMGLFVEKGRHPAQSHDRQMDSISV